MKHDDQEGKIFKCETRHSIRFKESFFFILMNNLSESLGENIL